MSSPVPVSFIEYDLATTQFPIQNLPYGVFTFKQQQPHIGVAIGDSVLDLHVLAEKNFFTSPVKESLLQPALNQFMSLGREHWKSTRAIIYNLLLSSTPTLRDNAELRALAIHKQKDVNMCLPARIGDYTDFYSSKEHASNLGAMFRGKDNALMPNWLWIPVGYHGRSSSIVVSGTPLHRPSGQLCPKDPPPVFGPTKRLDYELETAFFVGPATPLGKRLTIQEAEDHIFGMVIMNDWSARDIQKWEYVPLGPFGAKNFGTTISPWVVTLEALEPFRCKGPSQDPAPLDYLADDSQSAYDIKLEVDIKTKNSTSPFTLTKSNFKYLYWNMKQQLVHHTVTGCNMCPGDLCGSGTISGSEPGSLGSLVEITWGGANSITLPSGETRTFIEDGDTITLRGVCQGQGYQIGFGECSGEILPVINP